MGVLNSCFYLKKAPRIAPFIRGVWNLLHKFHSYLIIKIMLNKLSPSLRTYHKVTETEMIKICLGKNNQAVSVYVFITLCTLGCLRGRNFFTSLSSTRVAPSLSHSPLPVLTVFQLHVLWRHVGAILPECQI